MNKGVVTTALSSLIRNQKPINATLRPQLGVLGFPARVSATGGNTVTTIENIRYHRFTASGSLTVLNGGNIEILMISGGGGGGSSSWGGNGGGGGAGGALVFPVNVAPLSTVSIVVGAGGNQTGYVQGSTIGGTTSVIGSFGSLSVIGGSGAAAGFGPNTVNGFEGGACGAGISSGTPVYPTCGGGGGMQTVGLNGAGTAYNLTTTSSVLYGKYGGTSGDSATGVGGDGGEGIVIWGDTYCGGGGGGANNNATSSLGGIGGGGAGGRTSSRAGVSGTINTGGGGGGASWTGVNPASSQNTAAGGLGGSGLVVVRYAI